MSSSDNNITFKKTSFLSGINSEFINKYYSEFLSDPKSLPEGWKKFFEGLSEDEILVLKDINGPSWSRDKKIKKIKKIDISKNEKIFKADVCLVAVGRKPYTKNLNLDRMGIKSEKGKIKVNNKVIECIVSQF